MRFDTPIYFQRVIKGAYDPKTGNYGQDTIREEKRMASVTNSGEQTMMFVYGEIKQGSYTLRLQNKYTEPFAYIRIGDKRFAVDMQRNLRFKQTFVVREVQ